MKIIVLLALLFFIPCLRSQEENTSKKDSVVVFDNGTSAEFPGGSKALYRYFVDNMIYPEEALKNNESGIVGVEFMIDTAGTVQDVKIINSVSESIDKESIRVINSMPRWKPATLEGKKVASRQRLPIRFQLAK